MRIAVAAVGPHWLLPTAGDRELAWTWWQHVIGNAYAWLALAFLAWCAIQAVRHRPAGELGPVEIGEPAGYFRTGSGSLPSSARALPTMSASS
ncbi:hypothetical protein ACIA8G_11800 [Lentzea sp. NPDC051213]|uniref:hypothetical protein n=1 Tax=Lentzea sp. NPDC051213 TaxID=3364126 RepID=UPI0037AE8914